MIQKFENYVQKMNEFRNVQGTPADPNFAHLQRLQLSKFTLRIKQLFLNFLLYLINDFEDYYKKEAKYDMKREDETAPTHPTQQELRELQYATAHQIFDFKRYTRSENLKEFRE